jgi:hypothetical protein
MPSACRRTILTSRDQEILRALLSLGPLTPSQLLAWSGTLGTPFRTEHRTRARLRRLTQAGWVRAFPYATTSQGMLHYYKITHQGFRLLLGETATVPRAHFFRAVGLSRHPHTRMLADVLVHTLVCAHRDNVAVENLSAENALQIDSGDRRLLPDAAFDLVTGQGRRFHLFVEIDNGTEPLRARLFRNALCEKIRLYEAHADQSPNRFRVLFVTTGVERVRHVLDLARELASEPDRWLFYGITLDGYLQMPSLRSPHLLNHAHQVVAVVRDTAPVAARPIQKPAETPHLLPVASLAGKVW